MKVTSRTTASGIFVTLIVLGQFVSTGCETDSSEQVPNSQSDGTKISTTVVKSHTISDSSSALKKETSISPSKTKLKFLSEKIQMNILPSGREVVISGRYRFLNNRSQKWFSRLYFPFYIDPDHPLPTTIKVKPGKFKRRKQGILYMLFMGPRKTKEIIVAYKQAAPRQSATYIVTSASGWGTNLKIARFDVILPVEFKLKHSSFPMELQKKDPVNQLFRYEIQNFHPDTEFTVEWTKK